MGNAVTKQERKKELLLSSPLNNKLAVSELKTSNDVFRKLYPGMNLSDITNDFKHRLSTMSTSTGEDWQSDKHMNLKQLTGTKLVREFSHLPQMLAFQFSECYHLNKASICFKAIIIDSFIPWLNVDKKVPTVLEFKELFKWLTITVKKNVDQLPKGWNSITDIELFAGYNLVKPLTSEEKATITAKWGKGTISRSKTGDTKIEEKYYNYFEKALRLRTVKFDPVTVKNLSIIEFVPMIGLWMTDGSSRGLRVDMDYVDDTGAMKKVKSRAKKQAIPLSFSLDEIRNKVMVFSKRENYSVSEKIEPGLKYRCIISASFEQQIRLAYIEYCFSTTIKKMFTDIYFLQSARRQNDIDIQLAGITDKNERTRWLNFYFPLDAAQFDQYVSKREIILVFEFLIRLAVEHKHLFHPDVLELLITAGNAWFDTEILIDKTVNMGKWEHGVPSGVRWTALMDSIVNVVRFEVCQLFLEEDTQLGRAQIIGSFFQGDDMCLVMRRVLDTVRILDFYDTVNIPVHPVKNYMSFTTNEFLRKVFVDGRRTGYQNRMITKFLFRLPENRGAKDNYSLFLERCDVAFKMARRAENMDYFFDKVKHFSQKLFKLSDTTSLSRLLTTPSHRGGFSLIYDVRFTAPRSKDNEMVEIVHMSSNTDNDQSKVVRVSIKNAYQEQADILANFVGTKVDTTLTATSVTEALNPFKSTDFNDKIKIMVFKNKKFSPGIRLTFRIQSSYTLQFRPWMGVDHLQYPSLADYIAQLRRRNDLIAVLDITHVRCKDLAVMMVG